MPGEGREKAQLIPEEVAAAAADDHESSESVNQK